MPNSDPFFYPDADTPFLEATFGCILVGENLEVEGNTICRDYGPTPIPLDILNAKGDLVTAISGLDGPIPVALPLGECRNFLASTYATPCGIQWVPFPNDRTRVSDCDYNAKGDILVGNGCTQPLEKSALALPLGTDNQLLMSEESAYVGVCWHTSPFFFTGPQQIAASDAGCNTAFITGDTGDILYFQNECPAGWVGVRGRDVLAQNCMEEASLLVGCSIDQSTCFYPLPSQDGELLFSDSTCALNVKYAPYVTGTATSPGSTYRVCGVDVPYEEWEELPATAFPSGCKVFVQTNITMSVDGGDRRGSYSLIQGNSSSMQICWRYAWGNPTGGGSRTYKSTSMSYIVPAWDANCPLMFRVSAGTDIMIYDVWLQTTAFALQT